MITWPPRQTDGLSLNLDHVCEAVSRIQINKATPIDFEAIKATAGFFIQADEISMPIEPPAPMSLYDIARKVPDPQAATSTNPAVAAPAPKNWLTSTEVASAIDVSKVDISRATKSGDVAHYKDGRNVRVDANDVARMKIDKDRRKDDR